MRSVFVAAVLLPLALLGLTACGSTGRSRTASTASGLNELRDNADAGKKSVRTTINTLSALETGTGDLMPRYEGFLKEFAGLESIAATSRSNADAMREKGTAYFAAWEEQIGAMSNPEVKQRSEERRNELNALYTNLTDSMAACRQRYDKFAADLADIKAALDLDLSPNGVKNLAEPIKAARSHGGLVDTALDDVLEKLEALAKELNTVQGKR